MRVLLVEDDAMIAEAVSANLKDGGYAVDWVKNGAQVAACLLYTSPSPRDVEESRMPSSA